jgi:peptidoglycan/LPS O-acetylase OafA/YrhL
LGVDMWGNNSHTDLHCILIKICRFFVISGYLMAQILSKYDRISLRNIGNFYQRRIRRIVPIFLLAICFVVYSGSFILTEEDFDVLCQDAVPALTFTTNLRTLLEKDDYWAQAR